MEMGQRLQSLRREKGFTQASLAEAAGISRRTLEAWEQGKRTMLFEGAVKLADALGVSLDELAGRTWPAEKKGKRQK
jgi:transcriptional regulator with XRE-family HTH domain